MLYCWYCAMLCIFQRALQSVLFSYNGIRRLHSNTMWVAFHPVISFWEDCCLAALSVRAFIPRSSKDRRREKKHPNQAPQRQSDSHYQLRLFLFLFTTSINHTVTGSQGQTDRRKGNFHQTVLSIKTSEMNVQWSHRGPPESGVERSRSICV